MRQLQTIEKVLAAKKFIYHPFIIVIVFHRIFKQPVEK